MTFRIKRLEILGAAGVIALMMSAGTASWAAGPGLSNIDTNADGSVSLQEAHDAATKKFDKLDTDHAGKLSETKIPPTEKAMREMAHYDKDHTIDKDEYMAGVDAAFKEADPKGSGMLDAKALKTKAGKHFLALVE